MNGWGGETIPRTTEVVPFMPTIFVCDDLVYDFPISGPLDNRGGKRFVRCVAGKRQYAEPEEQNLKNERETIEMRTKGKLSYIRLLVPLLLFAGVQMFAQAAADSRTPASGPASPQMTKPYAGVFVISDRNFLVKSIQKILRESAESSCSSNASSGGAAASFCGQIDCAAPPPGCSYQKPPLDKNGCPTGCGTLVCGPIE
jgi:hypothetical protein